MGDSSILKETLDKIDLSIEKYRSDIKRGEMLTRLKNNSDFQELFLNQYVNVEANKLFAILTDPSGATPYAPEEINLKLAAISHFKGFVGSGDYPGTIMMDATNAPLAIAREEEYRKQVTAEYAEYGEE